MDYICNIVGIMAPGVNHFIRTWRIYPHTFSSGSSDSNNQFNF